VSSSVRGQSGRDGSASCLREEVRGVGVAGTDQHLA